MASRGAAGLPSWAGASGPPRSSSTSALLRQRLEASIAGAQRQGLGAPAGRQRDRRTQISPPRPPHPRSVGSSGRARRELQGPGNLRTAVGTAQDQWLSGGRSANGRQDAEEAAWARSHEQPHRFPPGTELHSPAGGSRRSSTDLPRVVPSQRGTPESWKVGPLARELEEENRALRALAEKLHLELAAVTEREQYYREACGAGSDTSSSEDGRWGSQLRINL
mmetsp:Transcript_19815/g.53053  ORF Transcript_19815/g.53053 Transcript_19815/m.53053 type:complete len:222 (-) Transcript_19815:532-1197(-)